MSTRILTLKAWCFTSQTLKCQIFNVYSDSDLKSVMFYLSDIKNSKIIMLQSKWKRGQILSQIFWKPVLINGHLQNKFPWCWIQKQIYVNWWKPDNNTHNQGVAGSIPAGPTFALRSFSIGGLRFLMQICVAKSSPGFGGRCPQILIFISHLAVEGLRGHHP
jgi:hypothetical protein